MLKLVCFFCVLATALAADFWRDGAVESDEVLVDPVNQVANNPDDNRPPLNTPCVHQRIIGGRRNIADTEDNANANNSPSGGDQHNTIYNIPTNENEYPYQVAIFQSGSSFASGSIISPQWILTTAAVSHIEASQYTVRVGSTFRYFGGTTYAVAEVKNHERYKHGYPPRVRDYDIAVMRIDGRFSFDSNVQPIALASQTPPPGAIALVVGWGMTIKGNRELLHAVSTPIRSCKHLYNNSDEEEIILRKLCTDALPAHISCGGDRGSPLVFNGVQVGVSSPEPGCRSSERPPIYSNVAAFRDWIKKNTGV